MSDLQLLFLVLTLLYLWECACWTSRGSVAFRSWLGRRWRVAHPGTLLGNQRGGFIFAHPFPPLGTVLMGTQFPLALSPESVLVTGASVARQLDQKGSGFVWSEIQRAEARGRKVLVNGQLLLKVHSPLLASKVVQLLRSLDSTDWKKNFRHPELGLVSLEKNLGIYAWHGKHRRSLLGLGEHGGNIYRICRGYFDGTLA